LTVKTIIHSLTPIEYPPTGEDGVAIVYHVEGWENVNSPFTDVNVKIVKLINNTTINNNYYYLSIFKIQYPMVNLLDKTRQLAVTLVILL
jgi:hypothetical protein